MEAKVVRLHRHALTGLAVVSTTLLTGLQSCASASKRQLELAAASGVTDPTFTISMIERLADALAKSARGVASLVASQATLDGRPSQRIQVDRTDKTTDVATVMRGALAELAAFEERDRARQALDVTPTGEAEHVGVSP